MIEWLMQTTTNGATYLQTIILSALLFVIVGCAVKTWVGIIEDIKKVLKGDEDDD